MPDPAEVATGEDLVAVGADLAPGTLVVTDPYGMSELDFREVEQYDNHQVFFDLPGRIARRRSAPKSPMFLVGPWSAIRVDPSVWGLGFSMGVLQFTVKAATQRLLQFKVLSFDKWLGWTSPWHLRERLETQLDEGLGALAALTITNSDGTTRPAAHADVTHVRWVLASIAPGEKGRLSYPAIIR